MFSENKELANEYINHLIEKFSEYLKKFSEKLKTNELFNEFEDKAKSDLMKMVKLSNERYKSVKSGNSLTSILKKHQPIYYKILEGIVDDDFYHNFQFKAEKKKFKNSNTASYTNELANLRVKIKEYSKPINTEEYEIIQRAKKKSKSDFLRSKSIFKSNLGTSIKKGTSELKKKNPQISQQINSNNQSELVPERNEENKRVYVDLLESDRKKFESQMIGYKDYLADLSEKLQDKETVKLEKRYTFITDDLKGLSYKKLGNQNVVEKKDEDTKMDLKKLIRLNKESNINKKLTDPNEKSLKAPSENLKEKMRKFIEEYSGRKEVDMSDVVQMVKQEIVSSINLEDVFNRKRTILKQFLNDSELPELDEYDKKIKRNMTSMKIVKQNPSINNKNHESGKRNESLVDQFQKNYDKKQQQWKLEDIEQEKMEKLEKEKKKGTKHFLKELKNHPRNAQKFVDEYSIRDKKVNEEIIQLNKHLGKKQYDKKKLNKKIDDYLQRLEEEQKNKGFSAEKESEDSANYHEMQNKINQDLLVADNDDYSIKSRENKPNADLVREMRLNNSMSNSKNTQLRGKYEEFRKFREQVIARDEHKRSKSSEKDKDKRKLRGRSGTVKEFSSSNLLLSKTTEQIIGTLRKNSLSDLRNISLFRKSCNQGIPIISQMEANDDKAFHKKFARNNTNVQQILENLHNYD